MSIAEKIALPLYPSPYPISRYKLHKNDANFIHVIHIFNREQGKASNLVTIICI